MASYTPGTYEGAARGYGGKLFVRVTVTVSDSLYFHWNGTIRNPEKSLLVIANPVIYPKL